MRLGTSACMRKASSQFLMAASTWGLSISVAYKHPCPRASIFGVGGQASHAAGCWAVRTSGTMRLSWCSGALRKRSIPDEDRIVPQAPAGFVSFPKQFIQDPMEGRPQPSRCAKSSWRWWLSEGMPWTAPCTPRRLGGQVERRTDGVATFSCCERPRARSRHVFKLCPAFPREGPAHFFNSTGIKSIHLPRPPSCAKRSHCGLWRGV